MPCHGRMFAAFRLKMPSQARTAATRTAAIYRQMSSGSQQQLSDAPVVFESNLGLRVYHLNRPDKLNSLNEPMLELLKSKIQAWNSSDLVGTIVGRGVGRAFCAGGDVAGVMQNAKNAETKHLAVEFFKKEFELNYALAALKKPYLVVMEGATLGGGVGLSAPASFRIATENTIFGMPETKIGYCPDVGATYYLPRLDGEIGTYLGLTGTFLRGREVYEAGFATHYVTSSKIPKLLEGLASLPNPTESEISSIVDEFSTEREPDESPFRLTGALRTALDVTFRHNKVEYIFDELELYSRDEDPDVSSWAEETLGQLEMRSPTLLKVALRALREGKHSSLQAALNRELRIACALIADASPDFVTGVTAVLINKEKRDLRPKWNPERLEGVTEQIVDRFSRPELGYLKQMPVLNFAQQAEREALREPFEHCLPSEREIRQSIIRPDTGMGITFEEVISHFQSRYGAKAGLKDKITDVVSRNCVVFDNEDGNKVWLKWNTSGRGE